MGSNGRRVFLYVSFLLFLISTACYSASAGLEQHSRQITSAFEVGLIGIPNYVIGPYQLAADGQTTLIDEKCSVKTQAGITILIAVNDQNGTNACDAFNAFRVLFAIAGVLSLIAFILSMVAAFCSDGQCSRISGMIIGIIGFAAGVASFAIFIDEQKNQRHREEYLLGFWLHVAGAGTALFGAFCAIPNPAY